jgi:hypothetical protein
LYPVFAHARVLQAHSFAERAVAEACSRDGDPNDRRLRYDAFKWFAGKMLPQVYSDKYVPPDGAGGAPGDQAVPIAALTDLSRMAPEERESLASFLRLRQARLRREREQRRLEAPPVIDEDGRAVDGGAGGNAEEPR